MKTKKLEKKVEE